MRGGSLRLDSFSPALEASDRYYIRRMKEILDAFPNKGPPHHPAQLCSHLYIGSLRNADDVEELRRLGITHVINCAGSRRYNDSTRSPYSRLSGIKGYLIIPAEDHDQFEISKHFPEAIAFLDKCRKSGGKALVHCNLGVNRSGAIVAAYLMVYQRKPLLQVISVLKDKRQFVLCNKGFRRQLVRFARAQSLLDPVIDMGFTHPPETNVSEIGSRRSRSEERQNKALDNSIVSNGGITRQFSTNSLDRSFINRPLKVLGTSPHRPRNNTFSNGDSSAHPGEPDAESPSSREPHGYGSLPRRSGSFPTTHHSSSYSSPPHRYEPKAESSQLDTVPERKPVCEFSSVRSKYRTESGPPTPTTQQKTVTFRRPTVSDVSSDTSKVASSPSASPKLGGFLSRIGTKITRQRSWTNISRTSTSEDEDADVKKKDKAKQDKAKDTSALSTQRPLRVYKRAASDTEVYRRPTTVQTYRRAETIATTDADHYERERATADLEDDPLLPQEFFYHTRTLSRHRPALGSSFSVPAKSGGNSINFMARLKPVPKSKTSKTGAV